MAITVKHNKVSTIPDTDDTSLVRPSDWNADHTLTGLGTMAEQNSNNVNITGGSITGVTGLGDVTGPASATDNAITRFDGTTGKLIQNSVVTVSDTGGIAGATTITDINYVDFNTAYATTLATGQMGWNGNDTLGLGMSGGNIVQEIGLQTFIYGKATATITKGQLIKKTGANGSSSVITFAPTTANMTNSSDIIGIAAENIANNAFGYIMSTGNLRGFNTTGSGSGETWADGDTLYYNPTGNGLMTKTKPSAPNSKTEVAVVTNAGSGGSGSVVVEIIHGSQLGGTDSNVQITSPTSGQTVVYNGTIWTNSNAPTISGGTINGTTIGATTASTGRFSDLTDTGLTSGRVVYASTGGNLVDASNFTYDGTNLIAGAIQNTPIGATTASTVNATTITGQTGVLRGTGQNLSLQSQTYTNATWSSSTATRADNQTTAPNGTSTAGTITSVNSTFGGLLRQFVTLTTTTYTLSAYVKKNNWRYVGLRLGSLVGASDRIAFFDFDTLATSTNSIAGATFTATDAGSGWYRLALTGLLSSGTLFDIAITASDGSCQTNTGAGNIVNVWGAQLELGSTANTYIPTTTTAVYGTPTLSFSGVSTIGLESNGSLYVSPAGTGALQAQATTSTTAGGNARGTYAVDWQTARFSGNQVASGGQAVIAGGTSNIASGASCASVGGYNNRATGTLSFVGAGTVNTSSGVNSSVVGGNTNTASGYYGFVGNGFTNSTTSNSAVTTQSGTMNATTAVTLSGSNANIKVGQYITGTSISGDTYVAAISGTSLTLSQAASGSSTSTLSFFTPHGVVVGGGNNQATGSYSFIGGGGDAGTAANRNTASGSWSTVAGGWQNRATGEASFVGGGGSYGGGVSGNLASGTSAVAGAGYGNTASGYCASVLGGAGNLASNNVTFIGGGNSNTSQGDGSAIMGGYSGNARGIGGIHVFPACVQPISSGSGVSQSSLLVLAVQTTDATATALRSNISAAGTTNQVILPNNSAYFFRGEVISGVTGGGDTKGWTIEGVIKRGANAASTALVGTPTVTSTYADAGASTWTIAVTADTTNGGIRVTFTGQASTTIRTVCQIRTTEMTY